MISTFNEREFLHDILDEREKSDDELLGSNDYYKWMYLIASLRKPRTYAEIGTYRGYSAYSVLRGIGREGRKIHLFDSELFDGAGSLARVGKKLRDLFPSVDIHTQVIDTSKALSLGIENIDMFYVDGDHSFKGCRRDLQLAKRAVAGAGGIIIVDDMKMPDVRRAVNEFIERNKYWVWEIPHYRGMAILKPPL